MTDSGFDDDLRVGNPERERAIELLNNALSDGYLEIHEFDERAAIVYAARTRGELARVVTNLPGEDRLFPHRFIPTKPDGVAKVLPPLEIDINWKTVARKGSWQVPARIVVSGYLGKADLDFSGAVFTYHHVDIELQVSASTVKVLLGSDHVISTEDVACGSWSSIKDKAGAPSTRIGPTLRLHGALSGWSSAIIRRG
ncbi:DUF1707 domain-containing protein [Nakamurella antarctica]|uniref:DUF1707 domain-containing protein n=1 Tax=Nakamurella antarctica TaxID=1902245 RepID=A0A3G8ZQI3_9ACTN|nr:DUF1707 domain-containing protein [Nakamurella antarctica]AZI59065.1 DUF1707 domain-containing protein [Nakamurella antarctica]